MPMMPPGAGVATRIAAAPRTSSRHFRDFRRRQMTIFSLPSFEALKRWRWRRRERHAHFRRRGELFDASYYCRLRRVAPISLSSVLEAAIHFDAVGHAFSSSSFTGRALELSLTFSAPMPLRRPRD